MAEQFPQMLYRPGKALKWSGFALDYLTVNSDEELAAAHKDGWRSPHELLNPLDHDGDGKSGGSLPKRGRKPKAGE